VGCAQQTPRLAAPAVPANLLVKCEALTPLEDGTAASVLRKLGEVAAQYYECADRHNAIVDALRLH
jgi:hypothetical protein